MFTSWVQNTVRTQAEVHQFLSKQFHQVERKAKQLFAPFLQRPYSNISPFRGASKQLEILNKQYVVCLPQKRKYSIIATIDLDSRERVTYGSPLYLIASCFEGRPMSSNGNRNQSSKSATTTVGINKCD